MVTHTKSKTERVWERPNEHDIIAEVNYNGTIQNQREITHYLELKRVAKGPAVYMIIPNIQDAK